ncbi:hypothetical protein HGRIS_009159 [Hohenbuehelia grisea]|uniref:Uncharacterized protein n=1 Tax=Hohenbuehelia grisea TaxID=104357 RepID=A0ABR3J0Q4_9AGAR
MSLIPLAKIKLTLLLAASSTVFAQQLAQVPAQCQSICNPVNQRIADGCNYDACCTADFANRYINCATCFGNASGQTDYTQSQGFYDSLFTTCTSAERQMPRLTLPGQNADRPLPSVGAGAGAAGPNQGPPPRPTPSGVRPPIQSNPIGGPMGPNQPGPGPNDLGGSTMTVPPSPIPGGGPINGSSPNGPNGVVSNGMSPNITGPVAAGARNSAMSSIPSPDNSLYAGLIAALITIIGTTMFVS